MSRPLGCLSTGGLVAALLTLLLIVGVVLIWGGTIFSPGPLNAQAGDVPLKGVYSHAETGGNCAACHPAPWEGASMDNRCLVCHGAVREQLGEPTSLHGALRAADEARPCRACHPEHRGAEAPLTVVDAFPAFPHEVTGYSLQGHRRTADGDAFDCADCHGPEMAPFDRQSCLTCHRNLDAAYVQSHVADFGTDCLACHDGLDTYGASFDHNRLAFPLLGGHASPACRECHPAARTITDLRNTPQDCFSCHGADDVHKGEFGRDCAACHSTEDWAQVAFDHDRTAFPLTGQHVTVACRRCHVGGVYEGTPQDCFSCHGADDAHKGEFGRDCAACHSTEDWAQAAFDHDRTAFPLTGQHVTVACRRCHVGGVYKGTPQDCFSCHGADDAHKGEFGRDCAACHNTEDWTQAAFDHDRTAFPLTGQHVTVACRQCHVGGVYEGTPQDCFSCHGADDVHKGEFGRDCAACHNTEDWAQVAFDHDRTAFPLTGQHVTVACRRCHVGGVYKGTPQVCVACHADPVYHRGLFGTDCAACHNTTGWQPARFDRLHTFPINHGESGFSPCRTCHPATLTAYTCYNCHEHNPADVESEHREEGITDFQNCVECHPTGREEEGEDDD